MVWEKGHSKGNSKGPKRAKGSYMGKTSKMGLSGIETRNQRQVQKLWNLHRRISLTILTRTTLGVMMGCGRFYRTATGECILDGGPWQFQGHERQDFNFGYDGGYMIPLHSKIGQGMRIHFGKFGEYVWKERTRSSPSL